jgi:hypothetical protein
MLNFPSTKPVGNEIYNFLAVPVYQVQRNSRKAKTHTVNRIGSGNN